MERDLVRATCLGTWGPISDASDIGAAVFCDEAISTSSDHPQWAQHSTPSPCQIMAFGLYRP